MARTQGISKTTEYLRTILETVLRSVKGIGASTQVIYKFPVDYQESLVSYLFFLIRFLLIGQEEDLDLTFTLNGFFEVAQKTASDQF